MNFRKILSLMTALAISAAFALAMQSSDALAKSSKSSGKKSPASAKAHAKKKSSSKAWKTPDDDSGSAENAAAPEASDAVPRQIVELLAAGDVSGALIAMREEKPTPKLTYLMRDASTISLAPLQKPSRTEAHLFYQNVGVSYHNLYLFLRAAGVPRPEFAKEALRSYGKARSSATELHRSECDLLKAALLAATGEREKAAKLFKGIDPATVRGDFESTEYLAAYHAAMGDADAALDALDRSYKLDPQKTVTWLSVGDDFHDLKDDARYTALLANWKIENRRKDLTLSVPKQTVTPKLNVGGQPPAAPGDYQFAPQMQIEHASKEATARHFKKKKSAGHDRHVPAKKRSSGKSVASTKGSKSTATTTTKSSAKKPSKKKSSSKSKTAAKKKPR